MTLPGGTVADALARPSNGFAAVRLGLALAVVVSHAFSVTTGRLADEPLLAATGFTLGEHAVNGFFAVSGFLVTMSLDRRGWRDYLVARALRIAPGFVAATLAVALGLGAALSTLPAAEYLRDGAVWRFVAATLTTFKTNTVLPGVFPENPLRLPMGTVWTLKYELICYGGLLAAGLAGLLGRRRLVLALVGALALSIVARDALAAGAGAAETASRLVLLFSAGGALYLWRDRARLSWIVLGILAAATAFAHGTPLYRALLFLAEAYGILTLSLAPALARPAFDLRHDFSYGIYLFGWPIQQGLRQLHPDAGAAALLGPSLALTIGVAALSWFWIERPALRLKARRLGRRTLGTIEPAAP